MHRRFTITAAALVALATLVFLAGSCASTTVAEDREKAFAQAVEANQGEDSTLAAQAAWRYLDGATPDDPRYDRALRLMALSAERMGLSYAASLWWLEIADGKRDPELIPEALRGIERIVRFAPHDHETLVRGFVASSDFGKLPGSVEAFIHFEQGLNSLQNGLTEWADARLGAIPKTSPYYARAQYVQAVRLVAERKLEDGEKDLEKILELKRLPRDLETDVRRSLARIRFEQRDFEGALEHYETIRQLAPDDPGLLLEMAWSHYYLGDSRRALGLLLALDAPVYQDLIAPERFLLEALCLRRLCQFKPARRAAVRLRSRHGDAIEDLYNGVPLMESEALMNAGRRRGLSQPLADLRRRLELELATIEDLGLGKQLTAGLKTIYDRGLQDAKRREREALVTDVEAVAEELLEAEEGVRLILHELSVALLRGRRRPSGPDEVPAVEIPSGGDRVFYNFIGEFWTDELDDLVILVEDRCID